MNTTIINFEEEVKKVFEAYKKSILDFLNEWVAGLKLKEVKNITVELGKEKLLFDWPLKHNTEVEVVISYFRLPNEEETLKFSFNFDGDVRTSFEIIKDGKRYLGGGSSISQKEFCENLSSIEKKLIEGLSFC